MKITWAALGPLFLSTGLALTGCQKAEDPVSRPPLSSAAGQPTSGTAVTAEKSNLPPSPPLPGAEPTPKVYQEVVGPKNLPQSKPAGAHEGATGNVRETIRPALTAPPTKKAAPGKVESAVKSKENVQPVKENKEDSFGPVKPPHPMPGA